jgi:hypothetical protein
MLRLKITHVGNEFDPVYIDTEYGERMCEVLGGVGVERESRARMMVNAIEVYMNKIRPHTKRGESKLSGSRCYAICAGILEQMELHFPEE